MELKIAISLFATKPIEFSNSFRMVLDVPVNTDLLSKNVFKIASRLLVNKINSRKLPLLKNVRFHYDPLNGYSWVDKNMHASINLFKISIAIFSNLIITFLNIISSGSIFKFAIFCLPKRCNLQFDNI